MIDKTLQFLRDQLNEYLRRKSQAAAIGSVELKSLIRQDGGLELDVNTLGMLMVNVSEEYAMNQPAPYQRSGDKVYMTRPPIHLNLMVLLVANFTSYEEALKFISLVILFFQNNTNFSKDKYPDFDMTGLDELTVKLQPLTLEQQNHLWGTLGAKFMPSIQFKVSILSLQENEPKEVSVIKSMEYQDDQI